jgi:hypothetical protein
MDTAAALEEVLGRHNTMDTAAALEEVLGRHNTMDTAAALEEVLGREQAAAAIKRNPGARASPRGL